MYLGRQCVFFFFLLCFKDILFVSDFQSVNHAVLRCTQPVLPSVDSTSCGSQTVRFAFDSVVLTLGTEGWLWALSFSGLWDPQRVLESLHRRC